MAFLLGVNAGDLLKALLKPKIKVGTEVVTQGRNKDQVSTFSTPLLNQLLINRSRHCDLTRLLSAGGLFRWCPRQVHLRPHVQMVGYACQQDS